MQNVPVDFLQLQQGVVALTGLILNTCGTKLVEKADYSYWPLA